MQSNARLTHITLAILAAFGVTHHGTANAALVSSVCLVNDVNVCENSSASVPSATILTIRGYAFDMATGDRPTQTTAAYVMLRNEDTLKTYKLPIQRIEARPDVVAGYIDGVITPDQYEMVNAGFIAQIFMSSLPPGRYSVQEVMVSMKIAGATKLPIVDANNRATFSVGTSGDSPFKLTMPDGSAVALSMGKASNSVIPATGYPALRDGAYTIEADLPGSSKSVAFSYKRPILSIPVSLPIVENFPGIAARLSPTDPLLNRALTLDSLPVVVDQIDGSSMQINGEPLTVGKALALPQQSSSAGVYALSLKDDGDTAQQQTVSLWVNLPDAPNINLISTRWNPGSVISVTKSTDSAAIKVEDLDIQAALNGGSPSTCQSLTMVRPDYLLSQTSGVNCAIQFGALPDGMKYNPYAPNALRGSVPTVGANVIDYVPGVVYTDPVTRKTSFYPAKGAAGTVSVAGTTPTPIALTFTNDKLLNQIYEKNAGQYPGKQFALVDSSQERSLGVVKVKGAYRNITTRITYPGDGNVKEVSSSITDSNVAMLYKADTPWATFPVKVESWYQKAPEFKTEQDMEFIGVPMAPSVNLDRDIISHDKAETIVRGEVGIPKGKDIIFDPAGMGTWQVFIRDEKGTAPLAAPVAVNADGTFAVNMGILSAGTRHIVAEAHMVDGSGLVSNFAVVSKSLALVTAVGETIEATLTAHSLSGKAPFAQTLGVKLKDPALLKNVKSVSWETENDDGTWTRVIRKDSTEYIGVNYTALLSDARIATFRAVLVNKFSGAVFNTEPITLQSFTVPTIHVISPNIVQVKKPVTLQVEADDGFTATYAWRIVTSGGYEDVSDASGSSFKFTPTEMKSYAVEVVARSAGAPDNSTANVAKTVSIKAVNPLAARASITGPNYVEAGKSYSYKATINDVVPTGAAKDYKILGYWMLPDGTRVDGTDLQFTPRPGDTTLSFYTYVEGYPEQTSVATQTFKTWTYVWPTSWSIKLIPTLIDVPASIKYYVEATDFDIRSLNGEPLTYTWSLPNDITRSSGSDVAGTLTVAKNGTYQVAVRVADTRGNVVDVLSDEFTILPAASVQTQASITSKYGTDFYAPDTYYIGLKLLQMPRGDSFLRNEVLINGTKVGEFTGSGNYVTFSAPGNYQVLVRTITKAGNYGEQQLSVDVAPAPQPICEIKQSATTSGTLITPVCTVPVGYIKSLTWTYAIDGVAQRATSKSFLVTKDWIANSRITDLKLTTETDLGATRTDPVTMN